MCISSNTSLKPKIAEEDIVCYKILIFISYDKSYYTPFQHVKVQLNKVYFEPDFTKSINDENNYRIIMQKMCPEKKCYFAYQKHMLHTFKTLEETKSFCSFWNDCDVSNDYTIVKAIIPKGSKYIEGIFRQLHFNATSFASEKIVYKPLD